ncbi:MAG TPA: glycosyltransferase family 9 protein [Tepidisphaeraceae bacterium]|nr:glycosyltransferase family 9 protein [Tepidisphaeraceae bacterium]
MPPPRNILLFHAGALGDFVVTWPLALALARLHPQSRLFYVTQRGKGLLAERVLRVESVDSEVGWHPLYAPAAAALGEPQAKLLAGAHSVVGFAAAEGDAWTQNVRRLAAQADVITATIASPRDFPGHVTDHLMSQLADRPAVQTAMGQVLASLRSRGLAVSGATPGNAGSPLVVHPGSGAKRKCWPADRFVSLIERLKSDGLPVRVILGEVELETWDPADLTRVSAAAEVVKPATYVELLDVLKSARAFVGNDTGPSHLAGIIGVPTVVLFGSNPVQWQPLGPRVTVIAGPSMESIEVGQVYQSVTG